MIPSVSSAFVARMEDVLDLYAEPENPPQCPDRRPPDGDSLQRQVGARECGPNGSGTKVGGRSEERGAVLVHWRFRATNARAKLPRLYPVHSS